MVTNIPPLLKIGDRVIGEGHPVYIIAEIGLNHQGDVTLAKRLIDAAVEAGVDCVKFQKRSLKDVYTDQALHRTEKEEQGSQYTLRHIKKIELSESQMTSLFRYSKAKGVDFLCTPWDEKSVAFLARLGVKFFKISSPDMTNLPLIRQVAGLFKPMIISTGMSFVSEIEVVVDALKRLDARFALLHCNSAYPAPYHDINLRFIPTMKERFGCVVGYSGHERGIATSLAAVALGASIVERHITTDRTLPGPDHRASLEPAEFKELVEKIRIVEQSLGADMRVPSRGEYLNRQILGKSLVAARNLPRGHVVSYSDITTKSPGKGTTPLKMDSFIGKTLTRDIAKDDFLLESDVGVLHDTPYDGIRMKHKRGIVVRMTDIDQLLRCNPDFVEVHLTDQDVREAKPYTTRYPMPMTIHAPEYNGERLLDLSSLDEELRRASVEHINRVMAYARTLKPLFSNRNGRPLVIVHPGGMNIESPLIDRIRSLNNQLAKSLSEIDRRGFEVLVENMPPYPWYFGGQWHHASFMDAKEIVTFSRKHRVGIAYDVSHAALYCNKYGKDIISYTKTILPVTRYLHVSDAAGLDGEGLQIGDGLVDFSNVLKLLRRSKAWVIPEIWQGHKYGGEGFMIATRKLAEIDPEF